MASFSQCGAAASVTRCSASRPSSHHTPSSVESSSALTRRAALAVGAAAALPLGVRRADAAPPRVELLSLGSLRVAPVGVGTWSWGNKLLYGYDPRNDEELRRCFELLVSNRVGPLLMDTADSYGTGELEGRSEQLLGSFSSASALGRNAVLATKLAPYPSRLTASAFVDAGRASARRLQRTQLDVVQAHWSPSYLPLQEAALINGLADLYQQELCRCVGVSNYGPKGLRRVHAQLASRGVPLASCQVQFSLLSRGPETNGLLETCAELGVRLLAYSPLSLGLLTGRYDEQHLPDGLRGLLFRSQAKQVGALLGTLREVAASRQVSPSQVAVNWCRAKGTLPIPGMHTVAQAADALACMEWQLSGAEVAALDAAAALCSVTAAQNIFSVE